MVQTKRVYEPPSRNDGFRVLIDRLWPPGIKKKDLRFDAWIKELAPSPALRKAFGHDPKHWKDFQSKYKKELRSSEANKKIESLVEIARKRNVTLLYGARDKEHNDAVVLKRILDRASLPGRYVDDR